MLKLIIPLISSLAIFSFSTSIHAQTSYPLTCRGGAGTLGINTGSQTATMYFSKTSGPAASGLLPGQCAWQDRAVHANEPPCLTQSNVSISAWIFPNNLTSSYFSSQNFVEEWPRRLLRSDRYETFQVYNPGTGGCFVVSRVGF